MSMDIYASASTSLWECLFVCIWICVSVSAYISVSGSACLCMNVYACLCLWDVCFCTSLMCTHCSVCWFFYLSVCGCTHVWESRQKTVGLGATPCVTPVSCGPVPDAGTVAFRGLESNFPFPECCLSVHRSAAGRSEVFSDQ